MTGRRWPGPALHQPFVVLAEGALPPLPRGIQPGATASTRTSGALTAGQQRYAGAEGPHGRDCPGWQCATVPGRSVELALAADDTRCPLARPRRQQLPAPAGEHEDAHQSGGTSEVGPDEQVAGDAAVLGDVTRRPGVMAGGPERGLRPSARAPQLGVHGPEPAVGVPDRTSKSTSRSTRAGPNVLDRPRTDTQTPAPSAWARGPSGPAELFVIGVSSVSSGSTGRWAGARQAICTGNAAGVAALWDEVDKGFRPPPGSTVPLEQAHEAHRLMEGDANLGRVALVVEHPS